MNDQLLVRRTVNISKSYIHFLHYIHPHFDIVSDINSYDKPFPDGIIYVGQCSDNIKDKLSNITKNWIIIDQNKFDIDLTTNESLIKNLLPLHYIKIKNEKNRLKSDPFSVYNRMSYGCLLEKIKICLIDNSPLIAEDDSEQSFYDLYKVIMGTTSQLDQIFFSTVTSQNVSTATSCILRFLTRVQSLDVSGIKSIWYARLVEQSNRRYGKYIKQAIVQFVKSKANKEVSLYNLLTTLNKAR